MTDILPRWKDESTLPSGIDPEMQKNPGIVLDQLRIVKKLGGSSKLKIDSLQPSTSTTVASPKPGPKDIPASKAGEPKAGSNSNSEKMAQMIKDATKHHGDVQAKLDAAAPYNFFLTSITDAPQTHSEPLTITFTGDSVF